MKDGSWIKEYAGKCMVTIRLSNTCLLLSTTSNSLFIYFFRLFQICIFLAPTWVCCVITLWHSLVVSVGTLLQQILAKWYTDKILLAPLLSSKWEGTPCSSRYFVYLETRSRLDQRPWQWTRNHCNTMSDCIRIMKLYCDIKL